jgi:hypothetical protein
VECLEETAITLFLDRKLSAERAAEIDGHIDTCVRCRRLLSELVRGRG